MSAVMNTRVAALLAASLAAGCDVPTSGLTIDCGPLDVDQCGEQAASARTFVAENWPEKTATRIEFTDETGAHVVTFSDETQGWVGE